MAVNERIRLLEASKINDVHSCLLGCTIKGEALNLRIGIKSDDYPRLNTILQCRPFESIAVAPYSYFFNHSYRDDLENAEIKFVGIQVEQLKNSKQFEFKLSKSFIANILWLEQIEDKKELEHLIDPST